MLIETLYKTLQERKRPEDVAEMIEELIRENLSNQEAKILSQASGNSLKKTFFKYTSMLQHFSQPVGAEKQIRKATELFGLTIDEQNFDFNSIYDIEKFIKKVSPLIGKTYGENDFIANRLNKEHRAAIGLDISKRRYNKLFRHLTRLEGKMARIIRQQQKLEFQKIAKHGLVHRLSFKEFSKDLYSACFIAYYTAKCNLRSEFTIGGQKRPYDSVANMLFKKATETRSIIKRATPNYLAMSYVYPSPKVLSNLSDTQKGQLLGEWTKTLQEIASLLEEVWESNNFRKATMIVKKGDDSTTWNNTAGAWNKARDAWINLIYALGMDYILEEMCFGKVMRLMAADVAYWHQSVGNTLDPNTQVWNRLPLPWQVFNQSDFCNKAMVVKACKKAGVDPEQSGWIAPRPHGIVPFEPTPELVHGVSVYNPYLATILKRHKVFSGKQTVSFNPNLN